MAIKKKWSDFIQCFKEQVHCKAKRIVEAIGKNGIFYASALKHIKMEFQNPHAVAHLKLNDHPQISIYDSKRIRHFHRKMKGTVSWLKPMGYNSS